LSPLLVVI